MPIKKIVIADDEQEALGIMERKLREAGFEVAAFSGGKGVIDYCEGYQPDLMILDIVLGDIDGYSIASSLRKRKEFKSIPVIFITAKELEYSGVEKRLVSLGYSDFLAKPFSFDDLLAKIKEKIG